MKVPISNSDEVTSEELKRIKEVLDDLDGYGDLRLNDWERDFMDNLRERFDEYGDRLVMSNRQWTAFDKIEGKL